MKILVSLNGALRSLSGVQHGSGASYCSSVLASAQQTAHQKTEQALSLP